MTVKFILTGFSTFENVPQNPTEALVLRLQALLKEGIVRFEGDSAISERVPKEQFSSCVALRICYFLSMPLLLRTSRLGTDFTRARTLQHCTAAEAISCMSP